MAKYLNSFDSSQMDTVFHALSDPTRRQILERLLTSSMTMSEISRKYDFSLPTISEHVNVLKKAHLIDKKKQGRSQIITLNPKTMQKISSYVSYYTNYWNTQLDNLEKFLKKGGGSI